MPTYEFVCKGCHNRFSVFTTVSGREQACCPQCHGNDLQQIFKGVRFAKGGAYADVAPGSSSSGGSGCSSSSCSGCSGCG